MAPTTFAPGETVVLMEDYGSIWKAGDVGHVIEVEPAYGNVAELVHFVRTDGEVCEGVYAFRLVPGLFEKGDRVAIESNVYTASGEHYDVRMASVGDTGTVTTEADEDGDVYVRLDKSERVVPIAASGLVYLGDTEPTDEEVAEQEALDEAPSAEAIINGLQGVLFALPSLYDETEAEEAEEADEEPEGYDPAMVARADALALAYDVLIDAAVYAHDAGMESEVDHDIVKDLATFILGEEVSEA